MTISKWTTFVALALLLACQNKPKTSSYKKFYDVVDPEVVRITDTIGHNLGTLRKTPEVPLAQLRDLYHRYSYTVDSPSHVLATEALANFFSATGYWDSCIYYMDEARLYLEAHPYYTAELARSYFMLGNCIANKGTNSFKANYYTTKAAAICMMPGADTIGFSIPNRISTLISACGSNLDCEQYTQAMRFGKAALQLSSIHRGKYPDLYIRALGNMDRIYMARGQFDSAWRYMLSADSFFDGQELPGHYREMILADKSKYYEAMGQYDSALACVNAIANPAIPLFDRVNERLRLYILLNRPANAAGELKIAASLLDSNEENLHHQLYYLDKTMYHIRFGNRDTALAAFLLYDSVASVFDQSERVKMLSSIESEYDLTEKQKNIDRLDEQNRNVAQELHQKNNLLIISVLSALLLGVAALALLLLSRQRKLRLAGQQAEAQRDKIELEQRLLRTQMEPHFIFNTLNAMQSMVRNNENEKAILYLSSFARLLRTSLEHSRENYVPLTDEVEALRDYLDLQALRFEQKFDYELDLYEGYENDDLTIPPMLLQPFVENAILHGIRSIEHKGLVSVVVEKGDGVLRCTITDNGKGIVPEETGKKKSLAIRIAQERLEIAGRETGHPGSIRVHNNAGAPGTSVELLIPYQA